MSIFSSHSVFAGQLYSLNCTVTIVAGIFNITWLDNNGNELVEGSGISIHLVTISETVQRCDLIFGSLDYSDIGVYTCKASLIVERGEVTFNGNGSANITVDIRSKLHVCEFIILLLDFCIPIVPVPQVSISPGKDSSFIRGTVRTVSCSVVFTPPLPTNPNVSFTVFKDDVQLSFLNSSRVIAVQTGTTGTLTFQPLNFSDAGNYTCTATARDGANNPLIIPSSATDECIATIQGTVHVV